MALALGVSACGGGGSGSDTANKMRNSPTAPSGSGGSSPASGTWTGTITRPGGLDTLSVRWEAATGTVNGLSGLTGPMTLTNGAASVTVTAGGITGGNDPQGYKIFLSFTSKAGDFSAFPTCAVLGNSAGASQEGEPFPSPYTSISVPAFSINYNSCRGFIDTGYSSSLSNSLQETVQLNMHK